MWKYLLNLLPILTTEKGWNRVNDANDAVSHYKHFRCFHFGVDDTTKSIISRAEMLLQIAKQRIAAGDPADAVRYVSLATQLIEVDRQFRETMDAYADITYLQQILVPFGTSCDIAGTTKTDA